MRRRIPSAKSTPPHRSSHSFATANSKRTHFDVSTSHKFFRSGFALKDRFPNPTASRQTPVVGILGGVGSGKSSVIRQVTGIQFHIIDADRIGHELLDNPEIQTALRSRFGDDVFTHDGAVDRSQLAKRVFGDSPEHEESRLALNEIIHPAIRRNINTEIDSASRDVDAVILDAALLLEGGWDARCDWLIFVDTPLVIRQKRVRDNRGWSAEELAKREASQWSIEAKKERADFVVDNSGSIDHAAAQMKHVLSSLLSTGSR